jgi:hypothetical protein
MLELKLSVALRTNIRLGCLQLIVTNTLAYYATAFITAVKRFMIRAHIQITS